MSTVRPLPRISQTVKASVDHRDESAPATRERVG
jgi:hypothetical protein